MDQIFTMNNSLFLEDVILQVAMVVGFYCIGSSIIDNPTYVNCVCAHYESINSVNLAKIRIKAKSWLISFYISAIFSYNSYQYAIMAWSHKDHLAEYLESEDEYSESLTIVFMVSLICDLIIGSIYYYKYIDLLSGWVHHLVYISLCIVLIHNRWTNSLLAFSLCEIPTLALAIGNIAPIVRIPKWVIGMIYFPTRIVWCGHLGLVILLHGTGFIRQMLIPFVMGIHFWWLSSLLCKN